MSSCYETLRKWNFTTKQGNRNMMKNSKKKIKIRTTRDRKKWKKLNNDAVTHDIHTFGTFQMMWKEFPISLFHVTYTVYPKKYAHSFVVLCFVVVMQSFIMNSREVFIHIHQGCFAGTGAIVRLPQCQWSKPDGYGKISQCITTTKHRKAKTVCIFIGIYCMSLHTQGYIHTNTWICICIYMHIPT